MKTLADFKRRLTVGMRIHVHSEVISLRTRQPVGAAFATVEKVQGKDFAYTKEGADRLSWMGFNKASEWNFYGDKARHNIGITYTLPEAP